MRTQLAAAMIGAVLLAVLFGYGGITLFVRWEEETLLRSLDTATRSAAATIARGGQPDAREVTTLYRDTLDISRRVDRDTDAALAVLAAIASILGIWIGIGIAGRLARPIESVSAAARAIAAGQLGSRATLARLGSDEIATLAADFNAMAESLQRYDREVGESSAAIAHELRTPLAILRARLQAHEDGLIAPSRESTAMLIAQVNLLSRIVDDLQVLGMARSGRLDLQLERLDLAEFLRELADTIRILTDDTGIVLELDLKPATARLDRLRMRQVILALADNVTRHAASGGLIRLTCTSDGLQAMVVVQDRGPGVPSELRDRVFERFWRADASRGRANGGSGLGLAVCFAIVEAQRGTIKVGDAPGGGAEFTLCFAAEP